MGFSVREVFLEGNAAPCFVVVSNQTGLEASRFFLNIKDAMSLAEILSCARAI